MKQWLCSAFLLLATFPVLAQPTDENVHEIVIRGKVPGPPMWEIRNGENSLWIFGVLSPLPKGLEWDSTQVEKIISQSQAVLEQPGFNSSEDIGILGGINLYRHFRRIRKNMPGDTLEEVLPAEVYTRLVAAKETYGPWGNGIYKLRPLFAAAEIGEQAGASVNLVSSTFITRRINRLIKKSEAVPLSSQVEIEAPISELLVEIDTMPLAAEINCLGTMLEGIETDLYEMRTRAESWAYGYMGELYAQQFPNPQESCISAITSGPNLKVLAGQAMELWLENAEHALNTYQTTFAVLPMYQILNRDSSLVDALAGRGYEVIEP